MIYLDTSVLLVHTLTESIEVARAMAVRRLFAKIDAGMISVATSFYALHEVYVFALENAPDVTTGSQFGKGALQKLLAAPLRILPFVTRTERRRIADKFAKLKDASDLPHAVSAYAAGCERSLRMTSISGQSLRSSLTKLRTITFDNNYPNFRFPRPCSRHPRLGRN